MHIGKENQIAVVIEKHLLKAFEELATSTGAFENCYVPEAFERRLAMMCASMIAALEDSQDIMRENDGR